MHYRALLFCLLILGIFLPIHAQKPVKRAKVRTEHRASQRLDQKVDQGVDKAFNAIEGLFKKKQPKAPVSTTDTTDAQEAAGEVASRSIVASLLGDQGDWEAYTNPTPFSLSMIATETKRNGKQEETRVRLGATSDRFAMIMLGEGSERSQMILNTEDGKTTMISTDKKGKTEGFRMRMPSMGKAVEDIAADMEDYLTITRTGEHKVIDGYDCEQVIVKDSKHNVTTESWITQDLDLSYRDVFGGMAAMAGAGNQFSTPTGPAAIFEGFPILSVSDDGKHLTEMRFADIRTGAEIDRSLFDTGGVEIQELGF